jgi:hypothetical protein
VRDDTSIVGLGSRCTGDDRDGSRRSGLWTGGAGIIGELKPGEYGMEGPTWFKADAKYASSIIIVGLGESVGLLGDVGDFALGESGEKRLRKEDLVSHISSQPDLTSKEIELGLGTVGGTPGVDDRLEANL